MVSYSLVDVESSIYEQLQNSQWFESKIDCPFNCIHAAIGLNEEAGEVAGLAKKEFIRKVPKERERWVSELGDVLWYLTAVAITKGISLDEVFDYNCQKLQARRESGKKGDTEWVG